MPLPAGLRSQPIQRGCVARSLAVTVAVLVIAACTPAPTELPLSVSATETPLATALSPVATDVSTMPTPAPPATDTPVATAAPTATLPPVPTATETPVPEPTARYELAFDATWSAETHPDRFPGNPHFSGLIGAVHTDGAELWQVGGKASPGMRNMAETGGKRPLEAEVAEMVDAGTACELISGSGISRSPGSVSVTFTASAACPQVSVVTMIAPSPDWFVGVTGLGLLEGGVWADLVVVELLPWDAGTDSGVIYTSRNAPTDPQGPIAVILDAPFMGGDDVTPLGTFTFTRIPDSP